MWPLWGWRFLPENLTVVCACVQAIAGGIASLPCRVYQTVDGKRIERPDHPVARLIRQPNSLQSWPDLIEWLVASALLQGNGLAVIDHDQRGAPTGLYPIPWWCCQALLVPAAPAEAIGSPFVPNSKLVFDITQTMMPWPLPSSGYYPTGFPRRYFADEVLFLRDRSDDGIIGRSRLSRAPEALACGLGAQGFSTGVWTNGATVNGVLKHPGRLGNEASANLAQSWRDTHSGAANAGKVVVLEEAMTYEKIGCSPEDAELLDSRRFSVEEICRLFQVPPPLVAAWEHATFSNTASASEWFGSMTLLPWVQKLEREFSRTVFNTPDFSLSFDMSGLLRGSYQDLMATNVTAVRAGIMTQNEARAAIGLDPMPDADKLVMQASGGRPVGTEDGGGNDLPKLNGSHDPGIKSNGAVLQ
jgi:HK97 family phage portal protein